MSKFLHGPPKFSRGPPVGDRCFSTCAKKRCWLYWDITQPWLVFSYQRNIPEERRSELHSGGSLKYAKSVSVTKMKAVTMV